MQETGPACGGQQNAEKMGQVSNTSSGSTGSQKLTPRCGQVCPSVTCGAWSPQKARQAVLGGPAEERAFHLGPEENDLAFS